MASQLKTNLEAILSEKEQKIIPDNIRVGVTAFGVGGTFTSDADATAEDILEGKIAYVNGEKIVGTRVI